MSRRDEGTDRIDMRILRAAVEAAGEAMLITSADLDEPGPSILYANPAFTRLTGYAENEVLGRSPRLLQGPGTDRAGLDRTRDCLAAGQAFKGEALNYRKDGSTYTVEWIITPVRDAEGAITHWVSAQRDVTERRAFEDRQALMVRELHHRVKNTLATVQAVLNATMRSSVSMAEFGVAFSGRIVSLARTHALITENQAQIASFGDLLRAELDPYAEGGRIALRGPELKLPSEIAVPVSMALHELTTNAVRHGALSQPDGRVEVTWSVEEDPEGTVLAWTWNERDGPPPAQPSRDGFGRRLLSKVLTAQAAAKVELALDPDGIRVDVRLPIEPR